MSLQDFTYEDLQKLSSEELFFVSIAPTPLVFEVLMKRHHQYLLSELLNKVSAKDADDLAQDVWNKLLRRRFTMRRKEATADLNFAGYLSTTATNICNSYFTRQGRRREQTLSESIQPEDKSRFIEELITEDAMDVLNSQMSERESQIVQLRRDGLTKSAIAHRLEIATSTVVADLVKVKAKLDRLLQTADSQNASSINHLEGMA